MKVCILYSKDGVWWRTKKFKLANYIVPLDQFKSKFDIREATEHGFLLDTHYYVTHDASIMNYLWDKCDDKLLIDLIKNDKIKKPFTIMQTELWDSNTPETIASEI